MRARMHRTYSHGRRRKDQLLLEASECTRVCTLTRTHTDTHSSTCSQMRTHKYKSKPIHAHTHRQTHTRKHTRAHTNARSRTHTGMTLVNHSVSPLRIHRNLPKQIGPSQNTHHHQHHRQSSKPRWDLGTPQAQHPHPEGVL